MLDMPGAPAIPPGSGSSAPVLEEGENMRRNQSPKLIDPDHTP